MSQAKRLKVAPAADGQPAAQTRRIHLWSPPRACSTAMMYSFHNRPDTTVTDEPLYAHFLKKKPDLHRDERGAVEASQSSDWNEVVENVLMRHYPTPVVFHKHMAKHVYWEEDLSFMEHPESVHVLLIREPVKQLASWHRTKYERSMDETGLVHQFQLMSHLEARGKRVIVVDAAALLENPKEVLSDLCTQCGIPFYESMLQWPAGPRKEDGAWAYYYYASVHKSTHFSPEVTPIRPFPDVMKPLLKQCEPLYFFMRRHAIGVAAASNSNHSSNSLVWVRGRLMTQPSATILATDDVVGTGDAVRGCLRVFNNRCPLIDEHLRRIEDRSKLKGYRVESEERLKHAVHWTLASNDVRDGVVLRLVHDDGGLIVSTEPVPDTCHDICDEVRGSAPAGFRVVVSSNGDISNCHELGLCAVFGTKLVMPPEECRASDTVINAAMEMAGDLAKHIAANSKITAVERRDLKFAELAAADEVFVVMMAFKVLGIHRVNGQMVASGTDGPVTTEMQSEFETAITDEKRWATLPSW